MEMKGLGMILGGLALIAGPIIYLKLGKAEEPAAEVAAAELPATAPVIETPLPAAPAETASRTEAGGARFVSARSEEPSGD